MKGVGRYFWGLLFIVVGAALLLKYVYNINIPVMGIIIGFTLVFFGVAIMVGGFHAPAKSDVIFEDRNIKTENPDNEYNMIFSNGSIDLTNVRLDNQHKRIGVHVVFANGTVRINPDIPTMIKISSAFGTASVPNNSVTFGEYTYKTRGYREGEPYLKIEGNAVFGNLHIIER